eukprot:s2308_g10.t2
MFTVSHIHELAYPGDQHLDKFWNMWTEILNNIAEEDQQSDKTLRDCLWRKIKGSRLMQYDMQKYDSAIEGDEIKTRAFLEGRIMHYIRKQIEDRNTRDWDKWLKSGVQGLGNRKPGAPAETEETDGPPKSPKKPKKEAKPSTSAGSNATAGPILATPHPKSHGAKKERPGSRAPSKKPKKVPAETPCFFHFDKKDCRNGSKCEWSHDEKVYKKWKEEQAKKRKPSTNRRRDGSRGSSSGRSSDGKKKTRSPSPGKRVGHCIMWTQEGHCSRGEKCRYKHEEKMKGARPKKGKATPALTYVSESEDEEWWPPTCSTVKRNATVKFKMDADITTYEVDGDNLGIYPKRESKKPFRKVDLNECFHNAQETSSRKLGSCRARGIGVLLDNHEHHLVDQVILVVGPNFDIEMELLKDDEDEGSSDGVVVERMVPHVDRSQVERENTMCIVVPVEERDKRFIMDSGSGHDLIARKKVMRMELDMNPCDPITFHTANGTTTAEYEVCIGFGTMEETSHVHVLEDTPSVFSMGRRCMLEGYSFVWPHGQNPFMINKVGERIDMVVRDFIPYIHLGSQECEPRKCKLSTKILRIFEDESNEQNTMLIDTDSGEESTMALDRNEAKKNVKRRRRNKKKVAVGEADGEEPMEDGVEDLPDWDLGDMDPEGIEEIMGPPMDDEEWDDLLAGNYEPEIDEDGADAAARRDRGVERDDDEMDVGDDGGEPCLRRRGTLKAEAKTLVHILTHRYKNPYCDSCVHAKMKHFKSYRGAFQRKLKKFGDLVTMDFVDTRKVYDYGPLLENQVLIVRDRYTGMLGAFVSQSKSSNSVVRAFKRFAGRRGIKEIYADKAPEFEKATTELKIPYDHSLPGRPQNNSLAERNNQTVIVTAKTCLLQAGLPPCFWRAALECLCQLLNIEKVNDDFSAWNKLHDEDFDGEAIPFGALVDFKPSGARSVSQSHKFGPDSIPGVFAGYEIGIGFKWTGQYRVWALDDFTQQNLAFDTERPRQKLRHPHLTQKIVLRHPSVFPCKKRYEETNSTLEGLTDKERHRRSPEVLEDQNEEEDEDGDDDDGDEGGDSPDGGGGTKTGKMKDLDTIARELESEVPPEHEDKSPMPHYLEGGKAGDGVIYLDNDGQKVKLDSRGRKYLVDDDGRKKTNLIKDKKKVEEEAAKEVRKIDKALGEASSSFKKPSGHSKSKPKPEKTLKARKKEKKKKKDEDKDSKDATPVKQVDMEDAFIAGKGPTQRYVATQLSMGDPSPSCAPCGQPFPCCTSGGEFHLRECLYQASPVATSSDDDMLSPTSSSASTGYPEDDEECFDYDWDNWVAVEDGHGPQASWEDENVYDEERGFVTAAAPMPASQSKVSHDKLRRFPSMPCVSQLDEHRERNVVGGSNVESLGFNAVVSRPVGRKEMMDDKDAKASMQKEWKGQRDAGVYDFTVIREYDEVVKEAKRKKEEVHMARIHGICVEKNHQLPKGDPRRKFKGRGVLLGNQVKNQYREAAFFQDLGNSPASFEASRWVDFYGCLPGHDVKLADAIQAYIQANLTGAKCWVELPPDAWPEDVDISKFRRPVVRLVKALYGHPDAGTMWEQHCDKQVKLLGFVPVGEEWPSMYFHPQMKLLLAVYVDDLKMAGPTENLAKGWALLRTKLNIEPETDLGLYLGCILSRGRTKLYDGTEVTTLQYDMEGLLKQSVEKYLEIVGKDTKLKKVGTPSLPEETKIHPARAPAKGNPKNAVHCPWCAHSFDPKFAGTPPPADTEPDVNSEVVRGALAPHAASILMKLLYAARIARFDLLLSVNSLARNVTKWTRDDDMRLHHLMCYVNSTLTLRMIGWVGDDIDTMNVAVYADAGFAGCAQSLRSTSGSRMHVHGKHTRFPIAGGSKRQGCVSHSTPEAEIVAADVTLRTMGLPTMSIWSTITGSLPKLVFHDDNQGMISVVRSGRNPTMRHLERTHGISIQSLHEHFQQERFVLLYEITSKMAADIHTKGFKNPLAWQRACMLINLLAYEELGSKLLADIVAPTTDVDTTTRQHFQTNSDEVPNFPYTNTPILPPAVYKTGFTGKVGLQVVPDCDPIFVAKTPALYRRVPAGSGVFPKAV